MVLDFFSFNCAIRHPLLVLMEKPGLSATVIPTFPISNLPFPMPPTLTQLLGIRTRQPVGDERCVIDER
jgi:hypothetical protein